MDQTENFIQAKRNSDNIANNIMQNTEQNDLNQKITKELNKSDHKATGNGQNIPRIQVKDISLTNSNNDRSFSEVTLKEQNQFKENKKKEVIATSKQNDEIDSTNDEVCSLDYTN